MTRSIGLTVLVFLICIVAVGLQEASAQVGACCLGNGGCLETDVSGCDTVGGEFLGSGTSCADADCNGACCQPGYTCSMGAPDDCVSGDFQGAGSTCDIHCASALGTGLTYQGQIKQNGTPLTGTIDLEASLWVAAIEGNQVGNLLALSEVQVTNGLFMVNLDFGAGAFDGDKRWLELSVRSPHDPGDTMPFALLSPRQPVTAAPHALFSSAPWQTTGTDISYNMGNIGIGTTTPGSPLTVAGSNSVGPASASIEIQNTTPGAGRRWILGSSMEGLFQLADLTAGGASRLVIDPNGNVGIGTSAPTQTLEVVSSGEVAIFAYNTVTSGISFAVLGQSDSIGGVGVLGLAAEGNSSNFGVVGETYSLDGYGVYSNGDFGGTGAKYFVQPHPYDPTKEIRFVCLEGNESGTYFRGSMSLVNGRAHIDVPEEFRLVSELDGLTVQVTALGPNADLWVESKNLDRIMVVGNGNVEFDYFVNGVRRGFADHESIRQNYAYVPKVRGVPYGTQYRPGHRQILVENGILNPDFTPNENTAARMDWTLEDPGSHRTAWTMAEKKEQAK